MKIKTILRTTAAAVLLCGAAGARAEAVRGEINAWGTNWMATGVAFAGDPIYSATLTSTATRASSGVQFDQDGDWNPQWGSGTTATNAAVNSTIGQAHGDLDSSSPGNLTYAETSGMKYTFRLQGDAAWWYRPYTIQATTNFPASVLTVFDNSAVATTNAVTVTATLSAATSGEGVYARWTTNGFTNSALAIGSVSGTNATIAIPAQPSGRTVKYYVLTSTMPTNRILGAPDLCTLRGNNAAGTNFAYVVGTPDPVFGNCWHFPTNVEPGTVTMRNPTNPTPGANTYVYVGNYHPDADMTGGWVVYKKSTSGTWSSNSLSADAIAGNNRYWYGMIPSNAVALGETLQYYLRADYGNGGADTTYLGTSTQLDNVKYAQATNAAAHPFEAVSEANLGNAWHVPANAEPFGAYMRNPRHPYASNTVTIYNGNQAYGDGRPGNQSGGTLYYRLQGAGGWSSAALAFDAEAGNNKYWKAAIPPGAFGNTQAVEYVLAITYTDRDATYLGTTDQVHTVKYAALASAQANPYSYTYGVEPGTEPGYVWHGGNVVRESENTIQVWTRIGYEATNGHRWADHAEVRYRITTNGASRRTVQGVSRLSLLKSVKKVGAADLTSTNAMSFSHAEDDPSENGNAMWWVATIQSDALTNLETLVQYQVAAWNSAANGGDGVVRLAEYQADGASGEIFEYRVYSGGSGELTVNGQNADYTTSKFFIDEAESETAAITVRYTPPAGARNVEVFSNVGRRDRVDADWNDDGVPDGIKPPDGNLITTNDETAYFAAFPMTLTGGAYVWTTNAGQCGAFRLTARYQTEEQAGSTTWTWYSSEGRRDHAIVISPKKVLQQTMYELNTLTVKAGDNTLEGRSTFDDLIDPAPANQNTFNEFSIEYLNKIQANCLWFQPIHPSGYDRSENDPATPGVRYNPGSPYASRDYFSVNHFFGRAGTEEAALTEFTNFVAHCDQATNRLGSTNHIGTINVMLDGVFNHTSWDAEFGEMGVTMNFCTNKNDRIGWFKPGWFSNWQDYGAPATYYHTAWSNDIAMAPDRGDFGKWADVAELYYGKYSALVQHNPDGNGDYLNEQDVYDFAGMSPDTIDLWRYMGRYTEYWLQKTGNSLTNRPGQVDARGIAYDDYGIDGLRCDFGQGLPPQLWEYIINRTRNMKWNFMFMAETLDGGVPGYRSNRHFDILNESLVFQFTQAHVSDPGSLRGQLESRRTAYNGGAVLLNLTGHDEVLPWSDPWVTASRYAMVSAVMGVPMVFYGQEQGIGPYNATTGAGNWTGFTDFELNFGKYVPHFKKWNQLRVWDEPPLAGVASREMAQWHGRVNWARLNSPALQSPNQYFLSRTGGGDNGKIFAVAKYEEEGAVAAGQDAVLAFALFVNEDGHSGASDTYDLTGCWSRLGLVNSATNYYNVRNLASSQATEPLWETPRSGADLYANGIYVAFASDDGESLIYDDGAIVQYLKIEEADKAPQSITFPAIGTQVATNAVALSAMASSGLAVSFAVGSGPGTISGLTTLTFTGAGTVSIVASQAGDGSWNPAPAVTNTFTVAKAAAAVTLGNLAQTYDGTARAATAATVPAGLTVGFTYDGSGTAPAAVGAYAVTGTVNEALYQGSASGVLTVTEAIESGAVGSNDVEVAFGPLAVGEPYELLYTTSLTTGDWIAVDSMTGAGEASATLTHEDGVTNRMGYYRIEGAAGPSEEIWGYVKMDKPGNARLNVVGIPFQTGAQTLGSLMPPLEFTGHHNNAGLADQVMVWDAGTQSYLNLALYDLRAFGAQYASQTGWKLSDGFGPLAGYVNPVLPAGSAVWIRGSTTNDRTVTLSGEVVMEGAATNEVVAGLQLVSNPFSETVGLSNLSIHVHATGHHNNAGLADQVMVWDAGTQSYLNLALYDLRAFGAQYASQTGWKLSDGFGPLAGYVNPQFDPGEGFWIRAVNGGFEWVETNKYKENLE